MQIEPPKGWRFEPERVNIKIDESRNDPCSLQQDINFIFKGFAISGRVSVKYIYYIIELIFICR